MDLSLYFRPPSTFQKAVAIAIATAVLLYVAACCLSGSYGAAFFSIPIFVGFTAGILSPSRPYRASLYSLLIAALVAVVVRVEGVVCLFFALPVLVPMLVAGAFAGSIGSRYVVARRARHRSVGVAALFGVAWQVWAGLTDDPAHHPVHVAQAELAIEAPPEVVFAALTEHELRVESRWPWFLRVGLPMPQRMVVERPGLGGRVRFDFSQGTAFARITKWVPGAEIAYAVDRYEIHDLPFHITRLGRSPDYGFRRERVQDWLTILDTRYTLSRTAAGGSVLRRRIVWQRHLAPAVYFGWLEQRVIDRSQVRLLELIRARVAKPPGKGRGDVYSGA